MPDRTSKPSPKPRFTKQMLSGSKSLSDLGVTAQSAKHPKGWTSAKGAVVDTDAALEELFSTDGVREALRGALTFLKRKPAASSRPKKPARATR